MRTHAWSLCFFDGIRFKSIFWFTVKKHIALTDILMAKGELDVPHAWLIASSYLGEQTKEEFMEGVEFPPTESEEDSIEEVEEINHLDIN